MFFALDVIVGDLPVLDGVEVVHAPHVQREGGIVPLQNAQPNPT